MWLYEVNASLELTQVKKEVFADWIHQHAQEVVRVGEFLRCEIFEQLPMDKDDNLFSSWVCHYWQNDYSLLTRYLETIAPALRAKTQVQFPHGISFQRRILYSKG